MSELTEAARRELGILERQLDAELAVNPTYQKIKKIKAFLADYAPDDVHANALGATAPSAGAIVDLRTAAAVVNNALFRTPSRKSRLLAMVGELIDQAGGRVSRQSIINEAVKRDLVPEETAVQIIAPILSEAEEFESDGKGNWARAAR